MAAYSHGIELENSIVIERNKRKHTLTAKAKQKVEAK